mgnify:CR=1 FL=1
MRLPSVMAHQFSRVPSADIPRSSFDRSHGCKTTFNEGYLVPVYVDEALPGDTFSLQMHGFARMATPEFPVMDNMFMSTFFFAIPMRLIWDNWEKFNGAQDNPGDSTSFVIPTMTSPGGGYAELSLSDYFGIPTKVASLEHSSMWHRAYNLTWNEWFRDQNLQNSVVVDKDNGPDDPADYVLLRRGKRHDYFTGSLPWPQKGDSVDLPLGTSAPIETISGVGNKGQLRVSATDALHTTNEALQSGGGVGDFVGAGGTGLYYDPNSTLQADLSTATAATINQLRQAFQIQKLYERDARGGTRYTEIVKSHFGVTSPDARLQRPEYLGGGTAPINISAVPQTSSTDGTSPQGHLAAYATADVGGHGFTKSFTEHCVIIGLVSVRADLTYQQGLNRMFSRSTRWDFYWPALAHIGEQAVLSKEIYADGSANDDDVWGYQERFAEYRYKPSIVTGQFRSNSATPLDPWHLSESFASRPVLNASFIEDDPPVERVVAVPSEPRFLLDAYFRLRCARPMPVYGVPGLIDHF